MRIEGLAAVRTTGDGPGAAAGLSAVVPAGVVGSTTIMLVTVLDESVPSVTVVCTPNSTDCRWLACR